MDIPHLIVGGGLAGTTIAVSLLQKGLDFLLLESSSRLGGKIETRWTDEACYELGPNSFTNQTDDIFDLLKTLDLEGEILEPAPAARNRYILRKGKIVRLPSKPQEFLTTKSLSTRGKLRFLMEAFYVPKRRVEEESVRDFFLRHFGKEVADYFADPFVSGIFAGKASRLLLKSSFPAMAEAEANSSSLLRYLIKQRKTAKASPQTYQLMRGLESIFHNALQKIGDQRIRFSEKVLEVIPEGKAIKVITDHVEYTAQTLYLTTPAYVSAECLKKGFPKIAQRLTTIHYAPVVTVHLRVSRQEAYPFDGFGILIPSVEKRRVLGVLWNSSSFPALFPDKEHHYLTVFVGGMTRTDLAETDDDTIKKIVCEEVQDLFALKKEPTLIQMRRHAKAIPQYGMGYGKNVQALEKALSSYPSLKLAGNYLGGISIPRTVTYAMQVASAVS